MAFCALRKPEEGLSDTLERELQMSLNHMWVLGIKARSSEEQQVPSTAEPSFAVPGLGYLNKTSVSWLQGQLCCQQ